MIKFILDSVFFGFGLWSLLFIFLKKNDKPLGSFSIKELDRSAAFLLFFAGITYFVLLPLIEGGAMNLYLVESSSGFSISWFVIGQLIYLFISVLLLYKPIRENWIFRFFSGLLFLISIEWLLIFLISSHHDYLPSAIPISFEMFLFLPLKGLVFSLLLLLLHRSLHYKS